MPYTIEYVKIRTMLSKKLLSSFFYFSSPFLFSCPSSAGLQIRGAIIIAMRLQRHEVSDQAVWSASLTGLMRFDRSSGELETFDKTNGLSDVLIREMALNSEVNAHCRHGNSNNNFNR